MRGKFAVHPCQKSFSNLLWIFQVECARAWCSLACLDIHIQVFGSKHLVSRDDSALYSKCQYLCHIPTIHVISFGWKLRVLNYGIERPSSTKKMQMGHRSRFSCNDATNEWIVRIYFKMIYDSAEGIRGGEGGAIWLYTCNYASDWFTLEIERILCMGKFLRFYNRLQDDSLLFGYSKIPQKAKIHLPIMTDCLFGTQNFDIYIYIYRNSRHSRPPNTCNVWRPARIPRLRFFHLFAINTAKAVEFCVQIQIYYSIECGRQRKTSPAGNNHQLTPKTKIAHSLINSVCVDTDHLHTLSHSAACRRLSSSKSNGFGFHSQ